MTVGSISAFHISPYGILEIVGVQRGAVYLICQSGEIYQIGLVRSPDSVCVIVPFFSVAVFMVMKW